MCINKYQRHSIYCILPPYVLRHIASSDSSTKTQRNMAIQALASDATFRNLRAGPRITSDLDKKLPSSLAVQGDKQRTIFSANNEQTFSGKVIRTEDSPASGDPAVDEAYDGLGDTYDFYWNVFTRNSIDDEGLPLNGIVHFGQDYTNAFWDGQRMVFGDGDNDLFNRFTISLDVIAHELTHGVTEDEAQLMYAYQSGSLNESISDVFGSLVKQKKLNQSVDQADWLIGAELLSDKVKNESKSIAIRSMKDPGSAFDHPVLGQDPQPKHMKNYVHTFQDNGGVHINSGIPNHAFYLAATKIGGHAWETAGRVWYEALLDPRLKPNSRFMKFAQLTVVYAKQYKVEKEVKEAWNEVGISIP